MSKEIKKMSLSRLMDMLDKLEDQLADIDEEDPNGEIERLEIENLISIICEVISKKAVLTI